MSPAALLLTALCAQTPAELPATATASISATPASETSSVAGAAATATASTAAAKPPAAPPASEPEPEPEPAPTVTAAPPPPQPPPGALGADKNVLVAWALSFGLGLGIGNWYADAPGQAIFSAVGEIAGVLLMVLSDGGARGAGLATFLASWVLDWGGAIYNAKAYNERLRARAELFPPTAPEANADVTAALPATRQLAITLPF